MSKLQKALEKAKEARGDASSDLAERSESSQELVDDIHLPTLKIWEGDVVPEKVDRISPSYNQSRSVSLDPEVMERNRCVAIFPNREEVEAYRILRTQILNRTRESGGNLIMITSALPGEGKTLTAINLALTFAREFRQTALLVDCDLKKQSIHEMMGFQSDKGLVDHLIGDCPVEELFVWPGVEKLTLISGGGRSMKAVKSWVPPG